jgi:hypothetical protein
MRRRDFIKGIVGSATAWPLAARAQRPERKRRVAVLMGGLSSGDPGGHAEAAALEEGLTELGWKLGGNIELDYRWPGAELDQVSVAANEIVAMRPDVVVSRSTPATAAIRNRGVPIVFVLVTDPKGSGFVQDLGRPGDAVTGFSTFEASVGGKWLGLLKETDTPHPVGLRKGSEWPCSRQSSSSCDKIASSHGWPPFGLRVGSSKHDFAAHNMRRNDPFALQNARAVHVSCGSKADIGLPAIDVGFTPKSGRQLSALGCPPESWELQPPTSMALACR